MDFKNQIPLWKNKGAEPSEELKDGGFSPGYKPPAGVFNWFWHIVSSCIHELQQKLNDAPIPLTGVCTTAKGTTAKVVTCPDFKIYDGARILVTFNNGNTANYMTLNVNNTGAYFAWFPIGTNRAYNNELISKFIVAGCAYEFIYQDGATPKWVYCGATSISAEDATPEFAEVDSREQISSGDKLSIILGKIKKWFSDLKAVAFSGSYNDLSDKPTSMRNPNSLTLNLNGSSGSYNGASSLSRSWYSPTSAGTTGHELVSNGSGAPVWKAPNYAVCSTLGSTAEKIVPVHNFKLVTGARVLVKFTYEHKAFNNVATLNVNNTGAKSIKYYGRDVRGRSLPANSNHYYNAPINTWAAGETVEFMYDGTNWVSTLSKEFNPEYVTLGNGIYFPGTNSATEFSKSYKNAKFFDFISFPVWLFGLSSSDALFDSTDVIQNAVDAVTAGGTLKLSAGLFVIKNEITIDAKSITIEGSERLASQSGFVFLDKGKLALSPQSQGFTLTLKNLSIDAENLACIIENHGNVILDNVLISAQNHTGISDMYLAPLITSKRLKMINCTYEVYCNSLNKEPCWSGIDCTELQVDNSSITIKNTDSAATADLNFIYNTDVTGYIRDSTIWLSGTSNLTNGQITIDNCRITLSSQRASLCHYTTDAERKNSILRDCTINYTASTYLTFGKIVGCTFKNSSTSYTSDPYKLQVLCPTQMTNNTFVGRSEMNFNGNKVLFANNILQYAQSYTTFPTGSVNANTIISG